MAEKYCKKCDKWKNESEFGISDKTQSCKNCLSKYAEDRRRKKGIKEKKKSNPIIDGKRVCETCGEIKIIEDFNYNKSAKVYSIHCRKCINIKNRQRTRENGVKERKFYPIIDGKKVCSKCGENKTLDNYAFLKKRNIYESHCVLCENKRKIEYAKKYPEKRRIYQEKHNKTEKRKEYIKNYEIENKEKIRERKRNYYQNNKEYKRQYHRERAQNNPHIRLRRNISRNISRALAKHGASKESSCFKYLDYSAEELKLYIESKFEPWMNWNNHGYYNPYTWDDNDSSTWTWQIDHIIPQSALPYDSMENENFKKCWSLENLRPLSAKENNLKRDKILDSDILEK